MTTALRGRAGLLGPASHETYRLGRGRIPACGTSDLDLYRGELVVSSAVGQRKIPLLNILAGSTSPPPAGPVLDHDLASDDDGP